MRMHLLLILAATSMTTSTQSEPSLTPGQASELLDLHRFMDQAGNPAALARKVNQLIRLGEAKATTELEHLVSSSDEGLSKGRVPAAIVALACYSRDDFTWPPDLCYENDADHMQLAFLSDVFPMMWLKGIPYWMEDPQFGAYCHLPVPVGAGHTYAEHSAAEIVEWGRRHAAFRTSAVKLPDDPIEVLGSALAAIESDPQMMALLGKDGFRRLTEVLQFQCLRMLEGVLDPFADPLLVKYGTQRGLFYAKTWAIYRRVSREHRLEWDVEAEKYVISN